MNPDVTKTTASVYPWAIAIWASFLSACALELIVFSLIDPAEVHGIGPLAHPSRHSVYTVAFFMFWIQGSVGAMLALWLSRSKKT